MKYTPHYEFEIITTKTQAEIYSLLNRNTEPRFPGRLPKLDCKDYWGQVEQENFKIAPVPSIPNSFLPIFNGTVIQNSSGANIRITVQLNRLVKVFSIIWLILCILFLVLGIFIAFTNGIHSALPAIIIPILFFIFERALTYLSFYIEIRIHKKALTNLINKYQ